MTSHCGGTHVAIKSLKYIITPFLAVSDPTISLMLIITVSKKASPFLLIKSKQLDQIHNPFNTSKYMLCDKDPKDCTFLSKNIIFEWAIPLMLILVYHQKPIRDVVFSLVLRFNGTMNTIRLFWCQGCVQTEVLSGKQD